jgi:hypothetical protein
MDEAELEYLRPGFEPQSATVPRLRSILVAESVAYPSSAKKADLIELFNQNVKPKAKKLLAARERTKRSTRGIKDVPSSQEGSIANDDESDPDTTISAAAPVTAKRGGRKTTRAATEEAPAPAVKAPSKRTSGKHARASDPEADSRPARRTHLSAEPAAPVAKEEDGSEPEAWHRHDAESPFTADNPFQSGSSPIMDARPVKKESRRKTLGPVERRSKVSADAHRRRTDFPIVGQLESDIVPPTSHTFEVPISQITKSKKTAVKKEPLVADVGEEFTPEEQLELEEEQQKTGQLAVLPSRRSQVARRAAGPVKSIGWATVISFLIAFAAMWRQEKLAVGYCGIGQPSQQIAGVELPEWAEVLRPQCEPCPPHAFCREHLEATCEDDFILKPHPLSLGGLVPLPPSCEPDSEKARKVKQVADRIVEELRERNAKFECGELVDEEGHQADNAAIGEEELKRTVASKRRKGMSNEEFEDLWRGAIGDVVTREEIVTAVEP